MCLSSDEVRNVALCCKLNFRLLFFIRVNDVSRNSSFSLILYAYDTTTVVKASDIADKIEFQLSFQELIECFNANRLKLSSLKSQIIKFQTVQDMKSLTLM
jgi:hypothetical protein